MAGVRASGLDNLLGRRFLCGDHRDIGQAGMDGYNQGVARRLAQEQLQAQIEERNRQAAADATRAADEQDLQRMGPLIAAGQCQDAVGIALQHGRLDLAEKAQNICKGMQK